MRARSEAAADRTRRYREEFLRLASAIEASGIKVVALKGMHLQLAVYQPSTIREMADLDILVRPSDLPAVADAVRGMGYEHDPDSLDRVQHHLPPLIKDDLAIEVHWRIDDPGVPPHAEPEELWSHVRRLEVAENAFCLAPEDAIVHVCAHAAYSHHLEQGIRPLCDLRALLLLNHGKLDWNQLAARASRWNCNRGVALCLSLTREVLGVELPTASLEKLGGAPPPDVLEAAVMQVFGPRTELSTVGGSVGGALSGGLRSRLRFAVGALRLPQEQVATLYPGWSGNSRLLAAWVMMRRFVGLTRRYGWLVLRTSWQPDSAESHHVSRRNLVRDWLDSADDQAN